jgi:hypothetical protein
MKAVAAAVVQMALAIVILAVAYLDRCRVKADVLEGVIHTFGSIHDVFHEPADTSPSGMPSH